MSEMAADVQDKVKLHMTQELDRTKNSLQQDIRRELVTSSEPVHTALHELKLNGASQVSEAKRERLLGSLKYPGFNERRNQVRDPYNQTYRWIFAGDGDDLQDRDLKDTDSVFQGSE